MTNTKTNMTRIEQVLYSNLSGSRKARFTQILNSEGRTAAIKYATAIIRSERNTTVREYKS